MPAPSRLYAVAAALVVVVLVVVVAAAFAAPLSYDAAYNLQVAQHLAHDGRYATDGALHGGTVRDFDAYITTGPTVLLPTGAVLALLGDHLWVTRLVPLAWFLALVEVTSLPRRGASAVGTTGRTRGVSWLPSRRLLGFVQRALGEVWRLRGTSEPALARVEVADETAA